MADFDWPAGIVPYAVEFYLQPHTGGTESPFSRVSKIYGLSAPRWVCRLSVRGGDSARWGNSGFARWGQRMDAFLAALKGRQNRVRLWDFRRDDMTSPLWPKAASNLAASAGATSITITGLAPGTPVFNGDYIGGDGRPHVIGGNSFEAVHTNADANGQAVVSFEPPLKAAIGAGAAVFGKSTGLFRLTSDEAGSNMSEVGQLTSYALEFVEDI